MNRPEFRIPEEKSQEVFTRAAQLYAKHNQSYTVQELMEAGAEARIPPEFIQQAIDELQLVHTQQSVPTAQNRRRKYLIGLAIGLPLLAAIAGAGWLITRNTASNAQVQQPISGEPPLSNPNQVVGEFKCAKLNLEGQDLRGKRITDCTEANLAGADLSGANLNSANLSKTDLKKANLQDADLRGADLTQADLTGADLSGAKLRGANLSKTDLRGANLENTDIGEADTAEAILDGAKE
jgi:hypothetical protein